MRYLKKTTVVHRFKRDLLSEAEGIDELGLLEMWMMYLHVLIETKEISKHQGKTWKYPTKKELK
jgi:hypothetical protein